MADSKDSKSAPAAAVVGADAKLDWKPEFCLGSLPETQRGYGTPIYYNPNLGGVLTYGSGNLAFIRNYKNPAICDTFTTNEHKGRITVVVLSPNGEWAASGDDKGIVLIWGSRPGQHNIKLKVEVNKRVWDICWSPDSQRVVAVGDGAESKAKCFDYATGNNFGTIDGHSQRILSAAFKPTRPFRVATTSEDLNVNFYEGPPFKWNTSFSKETGGHDRYPNCVRYHPSGNHYMTVGADSKIFLFDGKDGKMVKKIEHKDNHKSAITSVAWNPSGTKFLTSSMDKTCKLWSFDAKTLDAAVTTTFTFGGKKPAVSDMQVSTAWADDSSPISLSLSGAINYLDEAAPDTPKVVVQGHQTSARGFAVEKKSGMLYTSDDHGAIAQTDLSSGVTKFFAGCPKAFDSGKGVVACAVTSDAAKLVSVGLDDKYRFHDIKTLTWNANGGSLGGEPTGLATAHTNAGLAAVTLSQEKVVLFTEAKVLSITPLGYKPNALAFSPNDKELAIAGQDCKVRVYSVAADGKVALSKTLDGHTARVTAVSYSPDGALLASADANRQVLIWKDGVQQNSTGWPFHNAAPAEVAWPSTSAQLATCALDQDIIIWNDLKSFEHNYQRLVLAHPGGAEHVKYASDAKLVSSGADRCVRTWNFKPN